MPKVGELLKEIIERGFPELSHVRITVVYQTMRRDYSETQELSSGKRYKIALSTVLKRKSTNSKTGVLAHELQHVHDYLTRSPSAKKWDDELYKKSRLYSRQQEELTDLKAYLRGFPEVLEFNIEFNVVGVSPDEFPADFLRR